MTHNVPNRNWSYPTTIKFGVGRIAEHQHDVLVVPRPGADRDERAGRVPGVLGRQIGDQRGQPWLPD